MARISLTDFVEVVSKSGTPKASKVAELKNRPKYDPATDFYRPLREHIVEIHRRGGAKADLKSILSQVTDYKKISNYPGVVNGYRKWWGNKVLEWCDPPTDVFSAHGIDVSVNPELGLLVDGRPYLIKLYFKSTPLSKQRIDIVTHLMETCLRPHCKRSETMAVLDTRKSKLLHPTVPTSTLAAVVDAELAYIAALWLKL